MMKYTLNVSSWTFRPEVLWKKQLLIIKQNINKRWLLLLFIIIQHLLYVVFIQIKSDTVKKIMPWDTQSKKKKILIYKVSQLSLTSVKRKFFTQKHPIFTKMQGVSEAADNRNFVSFQSRNYHQGVAIGPQFQRQNSTYLFVYFVDFFKI